jgi:hypothetical protein
VGGIPGGRRVALEVGVELGAVGVPVVSRVGEGVPLPPDGDGEIVRLASGDGLGDPGVGEGDGEGVAGEGVVLPEGVSRVAVDVAVSGIRVAVSDGPGSGGVPVCTSEVTEEEASGTGVSVSKTGEAEAST